MISEESAAHDCIERGVYTVDGNYLGKGEQGMVDFAESGQGFENVDSFEMVVEDFGWQDLKDHRAVVY